MAQRSTEHENLSLLGRHCTSIHIQVSAHTSIRQSVHPCIPSKFCVPATVEKHGTGASADMGDLNKLISRDGPMAHG